MVLDELGQDAIQARSPVQNRSDYCPSRQRCLWDNVELMPPFHIHSTLVPKRAVMNLRPGIRLTVGTEWIRTGRFETGLRCEARWMFIEYSSIQVPYCFRLTHSFCSIAYKLNTTSTLRNRAAASTLLDIRVVQRVYKILFCLPHLIFTIFVPYPTGWISYCRSRTSTFGEER